MSRDRATDAELIERCLAGEPRAWEELIERYRRLVYSVPIKMGLKPEDCDEVFQETYAVLLQKLVSVRERARVGLWLAVTARRKALDLVRRGPARRETGLEDDGHLQDTAPPPEDELIRLERQGRVRQALETLPGRCRKLLEGLYYRDPPLSYRELARSMKIAEGSLGPTRLRCFEKLRRALENI